jgi:hypothetical protein
MSNSSNDNRTGPPKLIEDSLRNISRYPICLPSCPAWVSRIFLTFCCSCPAPDSFLRGKALPGKARLNRAASPVDHSSPPSSSGRGSRDGSGVNVARGRSEQEGAYVVGAAAAVQ